MVAARALGGNWELLFNGYRISVWDDAEVMTLVAMAAQRYEGT